MKDTSVYRTLGRRILLTSTLRRNKDVTWHLIEKNNSTQELIKCYYKTTFVWKVTAALRRNPSGNWVFWIFSWQKPCTRIIYILHFKGYRCNKFSVITPKNISYGSWRKRMSKFTKWHLTHEIFRILPVFSQFLWNLTLFS